jgi:hypothetical protein
MATMSVRVIWRRFGVIMVIVVVMIAGILFGRDVFVTMTMIVTSM